MSTKAAKKVKILSGISLFIADKGGDLLEKKVMELLPDDTTAEKFSVVFFDVMDKIVAVISDNDPNNGGQVKVVIFDALHDDIRPLIIGLTEPIVAKIGDADNKAVAEYLKNLMNEALGIYTDDDEKNAEQFKALFTTLRKSELTKEVVLYNLLLNRLLKKWKGQPDKEAYGEFIKEILEELWKLVQAEDEEQEGLAIGAIESRMQSAQLK